MKTAIIGAGIGGLATAVRLAAAGEKVTVWEKNPFPGGKIAELRMGGFRFDTGPSLFTLPELTEELFVLCGETMQEHLPCTRLDVSCRYFYPDGSAFAFYRDPGMLSQELSARGFREEEAMRRRLTSAREVYELSAPVFLFSDFHRLRNFNTPPYRKVAARLRELDFLRTMHGANRRDFTDPRLIQLFDRYATYNGSSPFRAPATLNMIAHLENNIGAFFPRKGMYAVARELHRLAERQGVEFRFSKQVERIDVRDRQAAGVVVEGRVVPYERIVSDVDVRYLADRLLARHPLRKRLHRAEPSSSALIFYWCVRGTFPRIGLHNVLFSSDYRNEFRSLFRRSDIADDPTVYLFVSSKAVAEDAPAGCENWYVMVNAPADCGQQWQETIARTRENVIRKIDATLGTRIENCIVGERICTPADIERRTMSFRGALYGASSNSPFAAFFRHPNRLSAIRNLYFVGGSVHPGGGIPLCLASARIVCDQIAASR